MLHRKRRPPAGLTTTVEGAALHVELLSPRFFPAPVECSNGTRMNPEHTAARERNRVPLLPLLADVLEASPARALLSKAAAAGPNIVARTITDPAVERNNNEDLQRMLFSLRKKRSALSRGFGVVEGQRLLRSSMKRALNEWCDTTQWYAQQVQQLYILRTAKTGGTVTSSYSRTSSVIKPK